MASRLKNTPSSSFCQQNFRKICQKSSILGGFPLKKREAPRCAGLGGVAIATGTKGSWMPKYVLDIGKNDWLRVHDNIFDPANWEEAEK
jgi:hypothetical protein